MKAFRILIGLGFLMICSAATQAQQVSVDFDRAADFSKYKTFRFAEGTPAGNPMIHQRIISGIEAQLSSKGLRKVDHGADLVVIYHAATDTKVSVNTMGGGPFGGWRFGPGSATVNRVPVGQLIIDIGDASAKKFVWRGTASGTLSSKPEKNEKALNSALAKLFQDFGNPAAKKK